MKPHIVARRGSGGGERFWNTYHPRFTYLGSDSPSVSLRGWLAFKAKLDTGMTIQQAAKMTVPQFLASKEAK